MFFLKRLKMCGLVLLLLTLSITSYAKSTDFSIKAINGKWNGKKISLKTFEKKVVYMTFFATWCKPCLTEMKQLKRVYKKYKDKGLVVLAVSVDEPQTQAGVKPLVKRYKIPFPVVIDSQGDLVRLFNAKRATPFSVLFDRNHKIVKSRSSFQISDMDEIKKEILTELEKK